MVIKDFPMPKAIKSSKILEYIFNHKSMNLVTKSNINCSIFQYSEEELPLIDILDWKPPNNIISTFETSITTNGIY